MSTEATQETPADKASEAAKATQSPTPTPTVTPKVELSVEEYQRLVSLQAKLGEVEKANKDALEAKERDRIKALTDKGEIEKALDKLTKDHTDKLASETQRYADLERKVFAERKQAVIAQALAGRTFVSDAASQQVQSILDPAVEVYYDTNGNLSAVDKITRRDASAALKDSLDSPAFAHFFAASNKSGGAGQQGGQAGHQKQEDAPKPGSLEAIAAEFKANQAKYGSFGLTPIG